MLALPVTSKKNGQNLRAGFGGKQSEAIGEGCRMTEKTIDVPRLTRADIDQNRHHTIVRQEPEEFAQQPGVVAINHRPAPRLAGAEQFAVHALVFLLAGDKTDGNVLAGGHDARQIPISTVGNHQQHSPSGLARLLHRREGLRHAGQQAHALRTQEFHHIRGQISQGQAPDLTQIGIVFLRENLRDAAMGLRFPPAKSFLRQPQQAPQHAGRQSQGQQRKTPAKETEKGIFQAMAQSRHSCVPNVPSGQINPSSAKKRKTDLKAPSNMGLSFPMNISVLIPVFNQREALQRSLRALVPEKEGLEVLVVDLGSADGSPSVAAELDWVTLVCPAARLAASALSEAAAQATGDILFFLQPGSVPARGWTKSLVTAFEKGADAVQCRLREEDPAFPWAANLRSILLSLGQSGLGGPTVLSGAAVRRALFLEIDGFRPVADFIWLAFLQRLRQAGAKIRSLPQDVVLTPRPGAQHADAFHELLDDLRAAWHFRKTDAIDTVRLRRKATALILFGHDAFAPGEAVSDYVAYAQREQFRINLEIAQSYPCAQKIYFIGGPESTALAGQPSGVEVVGDSSESAAQRFTQLREKLAAEGIEALLLIRGISNALTHAQLRKLAEGPKENPCALIPASDSGEWLALWFDAKVFPFLNTWQASASAEAIQTHLRQQVVRTQVEAALPVLRNESDARALYYAGILPQAPA